jgi:hypothetical protein
MKRVYVLLFFFSIILFSCTEEGSVEQNSSDEESFWDDLFAKTLQDYSVKFQRITGPEERTFRGINLGMTQEEVRGLELEKQEEAEDSVIRYVLDFSLKENVDIEYFFSKKNQLKEINVTYYGSSVFSQDSLWNEFIEYYDFKLVDHKKNTKGVYWLTNQKDSLLLQKTGNKHYRNLSFKIK